MARRKAIHASGTNMSSMAKATAMKAVPISLDG